MPDFLLPDVGEGLTEAEVVQWRVDVGDTVAVNDVVVEIETAKSLVELPVPFAGQVSALLVPAGATVAVGTALIRITPEGERAEPTGAAATEPGVRHAPAPDSSPRAAPRREPEREREPLLVGYGPRPGQVSRRARHAVASGAPGSSQAAAAIHATFATDDPPAVSVLAPRPVRVLAKPPVRKLAKDLGVDLSTVEPTGPGATVTRSDVLATQAALAGGAAELHRAPGVAAGGWLGLPREERTPIRSVRKATAAAVTRSAFTAPHVTVWRSVDVTRTMRLIRRLRASAEFAGVRLSPLAIAAMAMCVAVRRTPEVNSRWDEPAGEIVTQRYVNLGVAVATRRGLVVPHVRDAHQLGLRELALALAAAADLARSGRAGPADLAGATMTITNIGVFGVDGGTPILPPGESAIVSLGAVREQAWVHKGRVRPRRVTTVAMSFDHRLIDGEQGARFVSDVCALMERPDTALAWS